MCGFVFLGVVLKLVVCRLCVICFELIIIMFLLCSGCSVWLSVK